ncbi:fimbrillin family protein [Bacteroides sp.]|uniref:fimbrillin family protein n=1 Tax=Bacteroides sp. TaxID=29523 RepID=UPI0026384199|nr:fimbrillin family protein [Bacteroides sp.]
MKYLLVALLFGSCTESELLIPEKDTFTVEFSVAGIGTEVTTTRAGVLLENDRMIRILAFRREGTDPDLSKDEYMGEAEYRAGGDNGTLSATGTPLLLRKGTYDFYALTPNLSVTRTDGSGEGKTCTVSVNHGTDYATSFTPAVTVTEEKQSVDLAMLKRHCTMLTFALSPKYQNVTSVAIKSAGLTNLTHAPLTTSLSDSKLSLEGIALDTEISLAGNSFTCPDADNTPYDRKAATIVLPRKAGAFKFKMKVAFNGLADTELEADLPADLVFAEGTHYTFTVKMKGGSVQLELKVTEWAGTEDNDVSMGDPGTPTIEVVIGEWKNVDLDALMGGSGDTPVIIGGWKADEENWNGAIGDYPGLVLEDALSWGSHDIPSDTGGGENGSLSPGDWTNQDLNTPVAEDDLP